MVTQISDNEIYFLIKYIKSVLWRVAKPLSYKQDARCLKVNLLLSLSHAARQSCSPVNVGTVRTKHNEANSVTIWVLPQALFATQEVRRSCNKSCRRVSDS